MLARLFESNASDTTDPVTGIDPLDDLTEKYNLKKYDVRFRPKKKPVYIIQDDFLIDPVSGKSIALEELADSRIDPTDPAFELSAIDIAFLEEDYDAVLKMTKKILEDDPQNISALIDKARALCQKDNVDAAIEITDQVLTLDPENACALHNKALYQFYQDNLGDALVNLNKSMAYDPDYIPAYGFKFNLLMELDRVDEALDTLEEGLRIENSGVLTPYQHKNLAERLGCEDRESALDEIKEIRKRRAIAVPAPTGMS